jgi:hypothetical protein
MPAGSSCRAQPDLRIVLPLKWKWNQMPDSLAFQIAGDDLCHERIGGLDVLGIY